MPLARLEDEDSRGAAEAREQESKGIRRFYRAGVCFFSSPCVKKWRTWDAFAGS